MKEYRLILFMQLDNDEQAKNIAIELLDYVDGVTETQLIDCEIEKIEIRRQQQLFGQRDWNDTQLD